MASQTHSKSIRPDRRILVLGMLDSIHLARWLQQFRHQPMDFLLIPSSPHRTVHPLLLELLVSKGPAHFKVPHLRRVFSIPIWLLNRVTSHKFGAFLTRFSVREFKPDVIHALELQNAGYELLRVTNKLDLSGTKLIVTNWGSDIYWFRRFPKHRKKITSLLARVDYYAAECRRDIELAREMGFSGRMMPVFPNAGGFSRGLLDEPLRDSGRNIIAIKGYHGWVGRAGVAIDALKLIHKQVKDSEIVFYSCNRSTILKAKRLSKETGLSVKTYKKGQLQHVEMFELFRRAKIYVGLSMSDGISTSLLEAMAMGAIPVQTNTACCDEWFTGTGVSVDELTPHSVADAMTRALELAKDHSKRVANRKTINLRASEQKVRHAAQQFYR